MVLSGLWPRRWLVVTFPLMVAVFIGVAPAQATELRAEAALRIVGAASDVSGAGDVNGDGVQDFVVGDPAADAPGRERAGVAYVVFGHAGLGDVDLSHLGDRGFAIHGGKSEDEAGTSVSAAGDVNADGFGDVLVTAPEAERLLRPLPGRPRTDLVVTGAAYIVFGRASTGPVDLGALGGGGVVVRGIGEGDAAGAGDVNGDGKADVVVGSDYSSPESAYVVFGGSSMRSIDVERIGQAGFRIRGTSGDLGLGSSVDGAGDVNGDGFADVIVGAPNSLGRPLEDDDYEPFGPGAAYAVLGRPSRATVHVGRSTERAFRIDPPRDAFGFFGWAVAGAGDVNGDGFADVIIGAPYYRISFRGQWAGPGAAFVVYGSKRVEPLRAGSSARGFSIRGALPNQGVGTSVDTAGDFNRDGLSDLLVGAPGSEEAVGDQRDRPGAAYVVYGKRSGESVPLAGLEDPADGGPRGFSLLGTPGDAAGFSVAAPGDVNADAREELLVAAPATCGGATRSFLDRDVGGHPGADIVRNPTVYGYAPPGGRRVEESGTAGADVLVGTEGPDMLRGYGGDDQVQGRGGNDCLFGEEGSDRLAGGAEGDAVFAGAGVDVAIGGGGSDLLDGGSGRDRVEGGAGVDELHGQADADVLLGGAGRDLLEGGQQGDRLRGGPGSDALGGEGGADRLFGGGGRDGLGGDAGWDVLSGGADDDFIFADSGNDTVWGSDGQDLIEGGGDRDRIYGGRGADSVAAKDGRRDVVNCGPQRDRFVADGRDRLVGCEIRLRSTERLVNTAAAPRIR